MSKLHLRRFGNDTVHAFAQHIMKRLHYFYKEWAWLSEYEYNRRSDISAAKRIYLSSYEQTTSSLNL